MLRALAVAALLALAVPAEARPQALPGDPPAVGAIEEAPIGSPLLRSEADAWLPILQAEGYAAASRSMQQGSAAQGEEDEDVVRHLFMALGDANGNGNDDVVLATMDGDVITYQALDGGRVADVLWTFEIPDEEYAYVGGDFDEDGVHDLERLSERRTSQSDDGTQWEERATATILSGRDLAPMTELQLVARGSFSQTESDLPRIGRSTWTERYTYEHLEDVEGQPGIARVAWTAEMHESEDAVLITTGQSYSYNFSSTIALLDAAGALRWAQDEPGWDFSYGSEDVTGDGVPDLLMRSGDSFGYAYSGFLPGLPIDPPVQPPVPLFGSSSESRLPFRVRLIDGASGAIAWEQAFGNATYSFTSWLGDLYGEGPVLSVFTADFGAYDFSMQTTLVNGGTGDVIRTEDGSRNLVPLGDSDRDGNDDLLSLDFNDSTLAFTAYDGDFTELWALDLADDDYAGLSDMDNDGVLDVLAWHGDNFTVYSGTDGEQAWQREEPRRADHDLTPGIVSADHREVAILLSDAKDHEDVSDAKADLLVLRGSDGASLWRKPLYDPADYVEVAGGDASLWVSYAGDLNGDGARDFIVELRQAFDFVLVCDEDECSVEEEEDDEDSGQPLSITLLVDGATGATITRFDDMELSEKVKRVKEAPAEVKPAAQEIQDEIDGQDAPGFALYAALAAVGVALALRRRT